MRRPLTSVPVNVKTAEFRMSGRANRAAFAERAEMAESEVCQAKHSLADQIRSRPFPITRA
jgi:hypothetical protein